MNPEPQNLPDDFQKAWQSQAAQPRVTIDESLLRKEVQRNQRDFGATILRRDAIEVGVGVLMVPLWLYLGHAHSLPWTWYLSIPSLLWMAGFFLVDRRRHPQSPSDPSESLIACAKNSLRQVEHQIWLLRNVFWWYLLPPSIPIVAFFAQVSWQVFVLAADSWWDAIGIAGFFAFLCLFLCVVYGFAYYINQRAVRTQLEPRRQELLALLASLGDVSIAEHVSISDAQSAASAQKLRRWMTIAALVAVTLIALAMVSGIFTPTYDGPPQSSGPVGDQLGRMVAHERRAKNLVGLAAMAMVDGRVVAVAADGERKLGSGVPLETTDRWHVGGITKSVTATMFARLVEARTLDWSDSVGDAFPDGSIHAAWQPVTLHQLLTDVAGAPANLPRNLWGERPPLGPERTRARRQAALEVISQKPATPPGKANRYSNVGYTIAAAMAEQATGKTWEELVQQEVYEPLRLDGAGFGPPPSSDDALDQPRGHASTFGGKTAMNDDADNTPIIGPAATAHMTLHDLCNFATDHLRGDLGASGLLSAESYQQLHAPELDLTASGWIKKEPTATFPHTVFWHNGANTFWYALLVFIPEKKMAIAVTSNDGDRTNAEAAAWAIVNACAKQINAEADPPTWETPLPAD